jgi:hypothetical protein
MTTESPQERIAYLPPRIQERIRSCPAEGQGVHHWLFRTARPLHEWFSERLCLSKEKAGMQA